MIAIENVQKFRTIDLIMIVLCSVLAGVITYITLFLSSQTSAAFISLCGIVSIVALGTYIIRKAGTATAIYTLTGLFTISMNGMSVSGATKVIAFIIAGILFELIFLIIKIEVHNVAIDIITAAAISAASIPLTSALLVSPTLSREMITALTNQTVVAFLIGALGAVVAGIVWHRIKTTRWILRFEYGMG
jgi:hypothetical protein